jgi:hypothetical protein
MSQTSQGFRDKIKQLQDEITKLEANLSTEGWSTQAKILMVVAAITPVIIFLALYFGSPGFVTSKDKGKKVETSFTKVCMWTSIFTIIIWACLYGYTYTSLYA